MKPMHTKILQTLQADFARVLLDAAGDAEHEALNTLILADGLSPERRLRIYRNNVFHGLTEALAAVYPVIQRLVGEDFFRMLAQRFIPTHSSRSGNLHDFGQELARFLHVFYPAQSLPYLPDVARLEWAYHRAFHAADACAIDITSFEDAATAHADSLRFTLNPAAAIIESDYPILTIWETNQDGFEGDSRVVLDGTGDRVLVNRAAYDIQFHRLPPGEHALLRALSMDAALAEACLAATAADPDIDLAQALYFLIQHRVLVDYTVH